MRALADLLGPIETVDPTKSPDKSWQYVDVSSVSNVSCSIVSSTTITASTAPSRARRLMRTGDVLFATVRPTLKRVSFVDETYNLQICSTGYHVARCGPELLNAYLFQYLQSEMALNYFGSVEKGTSYPSVSDSEFRAMQIPVPPLDEQKRIVAKLDSIRTHIEYTKSNKRNTLKESAHLRSSILSSAFAGDF